MSFSFKPDRVMPAISVEGTTFLIDVDYELLRQKDNLFNSIPFSVRDISNGKYIIPYDPELKNLAFSSNPDTFIEFDQLVKLDPSAMAKKFSIPVGQLPQSDLELKCSKEIYDKRIKDGIEPTIEILGIPYTLDYSHRENCDCLVSPEGEPIYLGSNQWYGNSYFVGYDLRHHLFTDSKPVDFPGKIIIEIPDFTNVDPSYDFKNRMANEYYSDCSPIRYDFKAQIHALSTFRAQILLETRRNKEKFLTPAERRKIRKTTYKQGRLF